jgi:ubiquinone biosynthesis protein Coq4
MRFPDFAWRRLALQAHDLHHAMTGYPMTLRGEFQIAAWEFAAGRYPHWGATLFCAPLVLLGLIWSPAAMVRAWRRGRQSRSLYHALTEAPS